MKLEKKMWSRGKTTKEVKNDEKKHFEQNEQFFLEILKKEKDWKYHNSTKEN